MHSFILATAGLAAAAYAGKYPLPESTPWTKNAVLAPLDGASVPAGSPYSIKWDTDDIRSEYIIELYDSCPNDCTYVSTIASDVENTGSYSWTPDASLVGTGYGIKLICKEEKEFQWSGHFDIVAAKQNGYCKHGEEAAPPAFTFPSLGGIFPTISFPSIPTPTGSFQYAEACSNGVCTSASSSPTSAPQAPAAPAPQAVYPSSAAPAAPASTAPASSAPAAQAPQAAAPAPASTAPAPVGTEAALEATPSSPALETAGVSPEQFATGSAARFGASIVGLVAAAAAVAAVF